ncbi:MAG: hypothetical protein LUI07_04410 [Lachnospiraceae bacterium]|nr:hypothetical protein [Lachnospiraceae bacterium]
MRKKTTMAISAAAILILALAGFGIYLRVAFQADPEHSEAARAQVQSDAEELLVLLNEISTEEVEKTDSEGKEEMNGESESDAVSDISGNNTGLSEENAETEWVLELAGIDNTPIIWAGDSRTLGMQKALGTHTEDIFIGAAGEGYLWLSETGLAQVREAIAEYPERPVVFNMGVNDYENLYNYMTLYEEVTADYPDTVFYFLSVNPVDDEAGLYITNAEIEDFNSHLANAYPDTYLDSYTWLMENNLETLDGIHYSEEDYRRIYVFVKEALA